jgi:hypothetical protein
MGQQTRCFSDLIWHHIIISDENGRKRTEKPYFYFRFYIFWRKRDRVRKMRVWKRNRDMRMHGNKQIRIESRKIKLE